LYKEHGTASVDGDIIDLELENRCNSAKYMQILKLKNKACRANSGNIRKKSEEGRRTGIGITAEEICLQTWLRYGTDEATVFSRGS